MTDNPATPAADAAPTVTFDDLFWLVDSGRVAAQAWCDVCAAEVKAAEAKGDAPTAETYRAAWRSHRARLAQFERLQTLIVWIGKSNAIKFEIARMARGEKQEAEQTGEGEG